MPNLDKTGPRGQGKKTGRGMGSCMGGAGRMFGGRSGYGFGCRRFASPKNELAALELEKEAVEEELVVIKEEIAALKKEQK